MTKNWNDIEIGKPELSAAISSTFRLPLRPYSESTTDALTAMDVIFGIKYFSWSIVAPDGTGAEPNVYVDIRIGDHSVIGEGFSALYSETLNGWESQEILEMIPLAICRAMLDANERHPEHVERALAWVEKYYPEKLVPKTASR